MIFDLFNEPRMWSPGNMALPTTIDAKTWTCQSSAEPQPGQGAGAEVQAWFDQHNR